MLIELDRKEYEEYASKHLYSNFIQNSCFAELKKNNRWNYVLLGLKENNKIIAGVALHYRKIKFGYKMFYAPRGYLLDYADFDLFKKFDSLITGYAKKNKGITLKIDPYLIMTERNKDGEEVVGGKNNKDFVDLLKSLGYKEEKIKPLQAKWMYRINIKDKTYDEIMKDMTSKTRQMIRKNEKQGVVIREGSINDMKEFKDILDNTADRRGFVSRPLKYFEDMFKSYKDDNYIRLIFADLEINKTLIDYQEEQKRLSNELKILKENKKTGKSKISDEKLKEKEVEIEKLGDTIKYYQELKDKYGDSKTLGGIIYLNYGKETLSFIGGAYQDLMEYQPFYTIHHEMIKYAVENNYDFYNFYGISGDFDPKSEMYGVYQFKRGFGGEVVELIGEYDKSLSFLYKIYKFGYRLYRMKK